MPELPEVETIARELEKKRKAVGMSVARVRTSKLPLRYGLGRQAKSLPRDLGGDCQRIQRVGKAIQLLFPNGNLLSHLGMTGHWEWYDHILNRQERQHEHVWMELGGGGVLVYSDPRRFGWLEFKSHEEMESYVQRLGANPLAPLEIVRALEVARQGGRSCSVKSFLMNGSFVTGVGNIYASEALFRARVRPSRSVGSLGREEIESVATELAAVLLESISRSGTTLRDYSGLNGKRGEQQNFLMVYGRVGEPCRVCTWPIEREISAGRSQFFCSQCQK